ncbi:E3 ubiquitin-protein ligase [Entamoeba marina]
MDKSSFPSPLSYNHIINALFNSTPLKVVISECEKILPSKICTNYGDGRTTQVVYTCLTCGIDQTSCICAKCFSESNHEGHDYFAGTTSEFTCDCGNESVWKKEGFCKCHGNKFEGNVFDLIPSQYKEFPNTIQKYFDLLGNALEDNEFSIIEMLSKVFNDIRQSYLFWVVIMKLLHQPIPNDWNSILKTKYNHSNVNYLQFFCEKFVINDVELNEFNDFIGSFKIDSSLLQGSLTFIFDLLNYTLINGISPKKITTSFLLLFVNNRRLLLDSYYNTSLFTTTLSIFYNIFNDFLNTFEYNNDVHHIRKLIYNFFGSCKDEFNYGSFDSFKEAPIIQYASILSLFSFYSPIYIKVGEHSEYDLPYLSDISTLLSSLNIFSSSLLQIFSPQYCLQYFTQIHSILLDGIQKYLNSSITPESPQQFKHDIKLIRINGKSIMYRIPGENQPISTIYPLLFFYTELLIAIQKENLPFTIPSTDAMIISEVIMLSACFKRQYIEKKWIRNNNLSHMFFSLYSSISSFETVTNDIKLLQILLKFVDIEQFIITAAVLFGVLKIDNRLEYQLEDIELDSGQPLMNFLDFLINICRKQKCYDTYEASNTVKEFIMYFTAAGEVSPKKISDNVPFVRIRFDKLYSEICKKKGCLRDELFPYINPLYPIYSKYSESLKALNLFNQNTLKKDRYEYLPYVTNGAELIFLSNTLFSIISIACVKGAHTDFLYYVLLLVSDANYVYKFNDFQWKQLHTLGLYLGKKHLIVYDCSVVVERVGGALLNGFKQGIKSFNQQKSNDDNKKLASKKKEFFLKKMMKMQQHYNTNSEINDIENDATNDNVDSDDICVICQCQTNEPLGRMVNVSYGISVIIQTEKEGGKTNANNVLSTCCHHIHFSCLDGMTRRGKCPICSFKYSNFIPLANSVIKYSIDDLSNIVTSIQTPPPYQSKLYSIKDGYTMVQSPQLTQLQKHQTNKDFMILLSCIQSTIASIELCVRDGYEIDHLDKDLIYTLFIMLQKLIVNKKEVKEMLRNSCCYNPFDLYVLQRASCISINESIQQHVNNIITLYKNLDIQSIEDIVMKLSITFIQMIKIFEECIGAPSKTIDPKQFISTSIVNELPSMPYISSEPQPNELFNFPNSISEVIALTSKNKCICCGTELLSVNTFQCCYCKQYLCNKKECITQHIFNCSHNSILLLSIKKASIQHQSGLYSIYDDLFGERYSMDDIIDESVLNKDRLKQFRLSYLRNELQSNPSIK